MDKLKIQLLSETAKVPVKATTLSAGYDLYSDEEVRIPAGDRRLVGTGIAITVPPKTYGRIGSRSGLAIRFNLDVCGGICDRDYIGEIKVMLHNHGEEEFVVTKGMRCAQLILEVISDATIEIVEELLVSDRGAGGFGSTGTH